MTSLSSPTVCTLDAQTGAVLSASPLPPRPHGSIQAIGHTSDASQIASYGSDGFVCVHNIVRGTGIEVKCDLGNCTSLVYSPDRSKIAAGSSRGLYLFEARSLRVIKLFLTDQLFGPVVFSPDGSRVILGVRDGGT